MSTLTKTQAWEKISQAYRPNSETTGLNSLGLCNSIRVLLYNDDDDTIDVVTYEAMHLEIRHVLRHRTYLFEDGDYTLHAERAVVARLLSLGLLDAARDYADNVKEVKPTPK